MEAFSSGNHLFNNTASYVSKSSNKSKTELLSNRLLLIY